MKTADLAAWDDSPGGRFAEERKSAMNAKQSGITLLELMIVVAVVGILAAIAYPNYRDQVRRSNRSEAKIGLEQKAQAMEKCFTRSMDFTSAACANARATVTSPSGFYSLRVDPGFATTATQYRLQAVPQGGQASDTACASFTMDETGNRLASTSAPADNTAECWGR
jgi:type IV pilus assembly protein PilE